jgi:hypothetical protein
VLRVYSANPLNQQSIGRPVASLGHIILIPSQPVFAPYCQVFSVEATYNIFIVFGHTRPGLELMTYGTRGDHADHYTTGVVYFKSYI